MTTSVASYEARLLRVLNYIHDNPNGDLSLDTLADVAAMSRFHWHRVFHGMTGETCAQAVRRVRLHRAACYLVQTEHSLDHIAEASGLGSPSAFSRAFKEAFGTPPAAFRKRGELRPLLLRKPNEDHPMFNVEIETMPNARLGAVAHQGPYLEVGRAFEQVTMIAGSRNLWPHARGMMGLYYDDPNAVAAAELKSHAGLMLSDEAEMPDSLEEITVPGGKIARLRFTGPYAGLKAAYDYLYGVWLPESGEEPRDGPAMEIYLNSPADTAPEELVTDICMPIQ